MFKSLLILGLLGGVYACPVVMQGDECYQVVNNKVMPKLASYNDESYTITLTADELNNYTWQNLSDYFVNEIHVNESLYDDIVSSLEYNNLQYTAENFYSSENYFSLVLFGGGVNNVITFNYDFVNTQRINDNHFNIYNSRVIGSFEYDIDIVVNSTFYNDLKQAIELDIQANSGFSPQDVMTNIVTILVSGITGIANGIGQGVSTLVSNIFLSSGNHLSVFGGVLMVFAGIALAIGLCRWVMNLLTSLGAKK